jgi:hypothetical protein
VKLQVPPLLNPGFLSSLVAMAHIVWLSKKATYVALGGTAM